MFSDSQVLKNSMSRLFFQFLFGTDFFVDYMFLLRIFVQSYKCCHRDWITDTIFAENLCQVSIYSSGKVFKTFIRTSFVPVSMLFSTFQCDLLRFVSTIHFLRGLPFYLSIHFFNLDYKLRLPARDNVFTNSC